LRLSQKNVASYKKKPNVNGFGKMKNVLQNEMGQRTSEWIVDKWFEG
jgi:hypothetical protein